MSIDQLEHFILGYFFRGGPELVSVVFKDLTRYGVNETLFKQTVKNMVDENKLNLKGFKLSLPT